MMLDYLVNGSNKNSCYKSCTVRYWMKDLVFGTRVQRQSSIIMMKLQNKCPPV
jgi:hypothetical protein